MPEGTACGDSSDTECTDPDTCNAVGKCQSNDVAGCCAADSACDDANAREGLHEYRYSKFANYGNPTGHAPTGIAVIEDGGGKAWVFVLVVKSADS